jgi:hypothetical protein
MLADNLADLMVLPKETSLADQLVDLMESQTVVQMVWKLVGSMVDMKAEHLVDSLVL